MAKMSSQRRCRYCEKTQQCGKRSRNKPWTCEECGKRFMTPEERERAAALADAYAAFPSFGDWLASEHLFAAKQEMSWDEYTKGASRAEVRAIYENEKTETALERIKAKGQTDAGPH